MTMLLVKEAAAMIGNIRNPGIGISFDRVMHTKVEIISTAGLQNMIAGRIRSERHAFHDFSRI